MEWLSDTTFAALLGLTGALVASGLGYHQWRSQHNRERDLRGGEGRRKAREALWAAIEEADITLRGHMKSHGKPPPLKDVLFDVNVAFKRNSLYLDKALQSLATDYISRLHSVASFLAMDAEGTPAATRQDFESTAALQPVPGLNMGELFRMHDELKRQLGSP